MRAEGNPGDTGHIRRTEPEDGMAEGISGIAEESPGVNRFVAQKGLLLPSWQAGASQPCRPLACAVTT